MTQSRINSNKLLQNLKRSFFRGSLSFQIEPTDVSLLTWDWQQAFLDSTVNSALVQKYPIRRQFIRKFLKKIIEYLEGNQDVHDDLYSHLCETMNNSAAEDDFSYKHYLINNESEIITIKETNKMVVNGTTGMRTWEAALMLANWALCHREQFANKTILELGSGVGFTGITIAKLCQPQSLFLTDCHPDVMKTICDNVRINFPDSEISEIQGVMLVRNVGQTVGVMPLDWNSVDELSEEIIPDTVIGADIVYDPSILQPLCNVLQTLFTRNKHLEVYIASVIRNEETFESFLKCLGGMKFSYKKLRPDEGIFIEWDHTIQTCLLHIINK